MTSTQAGGGVWAPGRRALTAGLALAVTLVGFESLSVATVLPLVSRQLHGVRLYGWVFSAFFLGSLVGIVVAGRQADRIGLRRPFAVGLALFGGGLVVGGAAPGMGVLVAARAVQGFGAGAIPAAAYVAIGRGYPAELRSRMFAVLSTAWVAPGLVGPALAGTVADRLGWRWVFLGLVPLVMAAAVITVPQVARIGRPEPVGDAGDRGGADPGVGSSPARLVDALRVAVGAGLLLAGLTVASVLPTLGLVTVGGLVGLPTFVRLVPPGTLRARRGLPLAVLTRGVLAFGFFGADAYVPLTLTSIRGVSVAAAGIALTASTLTWTLGSWVQERRLDRWGPRRLIAGGLGLVFLGIAGFATLLVPAVPIWFGPVTWAVSGLGIGMAYSPISVTVLHEAAPGREGAASASLQLTEVLGVALGTGVGGAVIALGHAGGWDPRLGLLIAFGLSGAAILAALGLARRLPRLPVVASVCRMGTAREVSVPYYRSVGRVPPKRHTQFRRPDGGLYTEELMGADGFSGPSSLLYHEGRPTAMTAAVRWEGPEERLVANLPLLPRHFKTHKLDAGRADTVTGRQLVLANAEVRLSYAVADTDSPLYRNATGDECVYVEAGRAVLETAFGPLEVGAGDYVVLPTSTTHRWRPQGDEPLRTLVIEASGHIRVPARYVGPGGQFLESAPYCERDLRAPSEPLRVAGHDVEVLVRHGRDMTVYTYVDHPFDVVGWDGALYPYAFNIRDFEPVVGRVHMPPTVHQTFEGPGFVVCSFCPRPFDFDPQAIPVPYHHANVDSDEVLFYVGGDFMSRRGSGIAQGSISLHPAGWVHGPHPGAVEASIGRPGTDEWAVMVDTFEPLQLGPAGVASEDSGYAWTWAGQAAP